MLKRSLSLSILIMALLASALAASLHVNAQDGGDNTPPPDGEDVFKYDEPAYIEGGEADWTLTNVNFTSHYPEGFTFESIANSSAGDLVSASVFYSHNPGYDEDVRQRGEVDAATGAVTISVSGTDADDIPPWLEVNFRFRLSDSAGTIYWSEWFVGAEYSDNTRHWDRFESDEVLIFIQEGFPQEAVELSFDAMAQATPIYEQAFGRRLSYKPRMMLFADLATFQEWRGFEYSAGGNVVVGEASSRRGAFVQVLTGGDFYELAYGTVVHEIAHLYQFDLYEGRAPAWFIEGNATYFEFDNFYDYESRVRREAELGNLPRLFVDGGPLPGAAGPDNRGRWGYDVGYTFNKWLMENYGWDAHRAIIERMAEPDELPFYEWEPYFIETLEIVLGLSIDEVESAWRVWLGAPAQAATLIPTPTLEMRFPPTVTPFGQ